MVFYPKDTSLSSAPYAIYTRPAPRSGAPQDAIRRGVEDVIAMYAESSESVEATKLQDVHSRTGAEGELWQFSGYSNGGYELVTYFAAPSTVNFFVAQVPHTEQLAAAKNALLEISESYHEANDCKPCRQEGSCKVSQ